MDEWNDIIKSWQKGEPLRKSKGRLLTEDELRAHARKPDLQDVFDRMWSSGLNRQRNAYNVPDPEAVIFIPINRLETPYQTDQATNWDKVGSNVQRMERGEHLEPVVIGYEYDIHDGHHRLEASKIMDYTHVPCKVGGSNEDDVKRAEEQYREIWKSYSKEAYQSSLMGNFRKVFGRTQNLHEAFDYTVEDFGLDPDETIDFYNHLRNTEFAGRVPEDTQAMLGARKESTIPIKKAIVPDPAGNSPYETEDGFMYRGIGQKELDFIKQNGYIQSKGKGNDEDKETETCFTNLYNQAEGYARSNYDLYNEKSAYVIAVPKPIDPVEDEHGEIVVTGKTPVDFKTLVQSVPKP